MIGRHYAKREANTERPSPENDLAHVMRSSYPDDQRLTLYPLPVDEAETHADSLNHNDADDIRQYGDVRA